MYERERVCMRGREDIEGSGNQCLSSFLWFTSLFSSIPSITAGTNEVMRLLISRELIP